MVLVSSSREGTRIEAGLEGISRRGELALSVASHYSLTGKEQHFTNSNAPTVDILVCTLCCAAELIQINRLSMGNVKLAMWDNIHEVFAPASSTIGGGYRAQLDVIQKNSTSDVRHVVLVPALTHEIASLINQEVLRPTKLPPVLEIGVGTFKTAASEGTHVGDHCLPRSQNARRRRGRKRSLLGSNDGEWQRKCDHSQSMARQYVYLQILLT